MTAYIALLRGINVGGHKRIAMADLRAWGIALGLAEVQTVLQSGNLIFSTAQSDPQALERKLEKAFNREMGLGTAFLVRTAAEWRAIIENNPFPKQAADDPSHLAVLLLKESPSQEAWTALEAAIKGREEVQGGNRHAYIYYPDGIGNSRLTNVLIEGKLQAKATARNWNTMLKLDKLLVTG